MSDAILTELRSLPGAPDTLRERVRTLRAPQRRTLTFPLRRVALVAAPALVVVAVGAAVVHGLQSSSAPRPIASWGTHGSGGAATTVPIPVLDASAKSLPFQAAVAPNPARLTRYDAELTVQVAQKRLGAVTRRAMQIARAAGGYVAAVDQGDRQSMLKLRVPNDRVQQVVLDLGGLGAVTSQHVRIADLQRTANAQQKRIDALRAQIAGATGTERARLQQQLDRLLKAHAQTVREGSLATVTVTYAAPQPAAAAPKHESRFDRTLHRAGSFLLRELAWALFVLIVVGPIAALALALVVAARYARRRAEAQLLSSTQ